MPIMVELSRAASTKAVALAVTVALAAHRPIRFAAVPAVVPVAAAVESAAGEHGP